MARRIFLSSGHGGTDPGASSDKWIERDLAIEFRDILLNELKKIGVTALLDPPKNKLAETISWLKGKYSTNDILLDIHWNAGGGTGIETIVPDNASKFEIQLAEIISKVVGGVTGLKLRGRNGVKPESETARKRLGWMRLMGETVLLEMCFIDNKMDMLVYQNNKHTIATRLAAALKLLSEK